MKANTSHASALQAEQFDDLTWAMSVLAGMEEGDCDHAEWMLNTLTTKGCNEELKLAALSALMGGKLATA
jgi:hypothetical protein